MRERAFEVGDEVADAKLVELLGVAFGLESWRGERSDGTTVSVHLVLPGAGPARRAHFLTTAVELERLSAAEPIEGLVRVTAVDPVAGGYVGEANPIGTAVDLPLAQWDLGQQLECVRRVCETLARMHAAGRVHGCLCPEHVLLDERLRPVVVQARALGVAAAAGADLAAEIARSPYLAPETRAGRGADARADVYSLGRLLHFVLQGAAPRERDERLPLLASLREAPSGLTRIVRASTGANPDERYANAGVLVAELDRYGRGEKVGVPHPKVQEQFDPLRYAAALRIPGTSREPTLPRPHPEPARRAHDAAAPPEPSGDRAPPAAGDTAASTRRSRFWLVGLAGLATLAVAILASYLGAGSPTAWWTLSILGAALAAQLAPVVGPRPWLSRSAAALALVAVAVFADPTERAAATRARATGLDAGQVHERVRALLELRAAGRTEFEAIDLAGADLSGLDLAGLVLDGSSLRAAVLRGTKLAHASLLNVDVTNADLAGALLEEINPSQLVGWATVRCDVATVMPEGWLCRDGHPQGGGATGQ